jgi:hypothetical protein
MGNLIPTGVGFNTFTDILGNMSRRNVESTLVACDDFRMWHRANFLLEEASPEQISEHGNSVRLLLMTLRWLQATLADPANPACALLPRIDSMIRSIQDCWDSVHNPISDAEADAILDRVFPE